MLVNSVQHIQKDGATDSVVLLDDNGGASVENGNAARIVEQEKEKENGDEEEKDDQKKHEMENTFSHVMSVGPTCISAMALQKAGLRTSATPLDWIFSSPAMIEHCLRDDWRMFLDAEQYVDYGSIVSAKKKTTAAASSTADIFIGHSLYSTMVKKGKNESKIFLHRNPMVKEGKEYYERCVGRLRVVATSTSAVSLLLYVESSKRRSKHEVWVQQFRQLFRVLEEMWCGRFEFLVVRMQKSKKESSSSDEDDVCKEVEVQYSATSSGSILRVVHVLTDPEAPGLEDDRNLHRIIRAIQRRRNFHVVESSVLPRGTTQGESGPSGLVDELSKRPRRR